MKTIGSLLDYMEKHPQFAGGQFSGPTGKMTQRKMWEELSQRLNSLGYGTKSVEKWQKTWADLKYTIKKKSSLHSKELNKTGGGLSSYVKLNPYEERILSILGKTFCEGVGGVEIGIGECGSLLTVSASPLKDTTHSLSRKHNAIPSTSGIEEFEITELDPEIENDSQLIGSINKEVSKASNIVDQIPAVVSSYGDHKYCASSTRKRKATAEEVENELYKDTINELQEIKKSFQYK